MPMIIENRDHEFDLLAAHMNAFLISMHLRGQRRIGGLSDEDARRRLQDAHETMARLAPAQVNDNI